MNFLISFFLGNKNLSYGILIIFVLSGLLLGTYYNGYQHGKEVTEKVVNEKYEEIIKKHELENRNKFVSESNKYQIAIEENNNLISNLEKEKNALKLKLKSKSLTNKECNLDKEDISSLNKFIGE